MPEDTKKEKKEKTLSLKTNTKSSKSTIGARSRGSSRVSTVVVEAKRGKISKTRKPSAPNIKTRTSSLTSRKIKEPIEPDVSGSLTDKERIAREKALLDADTRKKNQIALEKDVSKNKSNKKEANNKEQTISSDLQSDIEPGKTSKKKAFNSKKTDTQNTPIRKKEAKSEDNDRTAKKPKIDPQKRRKESLLSQRH